MNPIWMVAGAEFDREDTLFIFRHTIEPHDINVFETMLPVDGGQLGDDRLERVA